MAQDVTITIKAKDKASQALAATGAMLKRMGARAKGAGASAVKGAKGMNLMAASGAVLGGALGVVTVAAIGTTAALTGLYKAGSKALDAWKEQEEVNRNLADSLSRAGVEADNLQSSFDGLNKMAGEFATKTMFGDEEILTGMAKYVQLTGDAKIEQQELSTILGIASKTKRDTGAAAELYAKALKGEIGPLKDVTSITKEQEERLNKIKDPTLKAAKAQEILAAQFAGVAEAANPTFNAIKNLEDANGDLWQMLGSVIERSGFIPIVLEPVTKAFRSVEAWVDKNHTTLQRYVIDGVMIAIQVFRGFLMVLKGGNQMLGAAKDYIMAAGLGFKYFYEMIKIAGNVMVHFLTSALAGLLKGFDVVLEKAESVAEFFDKDMVKKIQGARKSMKGVKDDLEGIGKASVEAGRANLDQMDALKKKIDEYYANNDPLSKGFNDGLEKIINKTIEVDRNLTKAKKNASKPEVTASKGGGKKPPGPSKARTDAADLARRNEIARRQLSILNESNDARKAALELNLKLYEIQSNKNLTATERITANKKAELDHEKRLLELSKKRADAEAKRAEATKKEREEAAKALQKQMQMENAALQSLAQGLSRLTQGADGVNAVAAGFEHLVSLTAEANRLQTEYNTGVITGAQAINQAFGMAAGAAAVFAEQMGATAKEQAVILSLFELAASVASFAAGDVFGGTQHAAASAMYAAVAATSTSAPSGSAGGSSAGASGGSGGSGQGPSIQKEREKSADMLAERLGAVLGGGNTIIVNYDDRSTHLSKDPKTQDQIANAINKSTRRAGIDPNANKYRRSN